MSMSSAMSAGVSGLAANSIRLATISDNIANSGTYGYKRVETDFNAFFINQGGGFAAGGVGAKAQRIVDREGAIAITSNPLDLAVNQRGMLPVTTSLAVNNGAAKLPFMMTPTGSFRPDEQGVLRTSTGLVLLGWPTQSDGTMGPVSRDTAEGLEPVRLTTTQTKGDPTTKVSLGINLPASETMPTAPGDPFTAKIEYFGNIGTSEALNITFVPDTSDPAGRTNTWVMEVRDSASDPAANLVGSYRITFDDTTATGGSIASVTALSGGAYNPLTGAINLTVGGGTMDLMIGIPGGETGMRQLDSSFSTSNITKNGSSIGNLTAVEIDESGYLSATYDTGFVQKLYKIPVVDVPNTNGLTAGAGQTYTISDKSGGFFLWDAGDGPTGSIQGYALEQSTTDVAEELTHLIETQRAYSSNAKIIQTVDEMLQETTNIKR